MTHRSSGGDRLAEVAHLEPRQPRISPAERRHHAHLRMLGHVKDAVVEAIGRERITRRDLFLAAALGGYNANPDPNVCNADPGSKVLWAEEDAEAAMAVKDDEQYPTDNE